MIDEWVKNLRLIYVVIDGMGDRPIRELNSKTPLEVADTPNMDELARNGRNGLMYTVGRGIAPESDVAVLSILGYDPLKYHTGRGPIEACGVGIDFKDGDLALRCNFATLGSDFRIIDRRAGRDLTREEASELADTINEMVRLESHPATFEFRNTLGYRGVLVIRGKGITLSGKITNTDPAYERVAGLGVSKAKVEMTIRKCKPLEDTLEARISADLVNEFVEKSHIILKEHEVNKRRIASGKLSANVILTRDAGDSLPKLFNICERYNVRFACLVDMPVERGIAKLAGMQFINLPPPSGKIREDLTLRAERMINILEEYDCFYIHLKGPDEPGHDGDFRRKAELIGAIDEYFFGNLLPSIDLGDCIICVTADHATPCELKAHSDDPVPLLISGGNLEGDGVSAFSERECSKGSLGTLEHGYELMPMLMNMIGR